MIESDCQRLVTRVLENTSVPMISSDTGLEAAEQIGRLATQEEIEWAVAGGLAIYFYGSPRLTRGVDIYYYPFDSYEEALAFSETTKGADEPPTLILQPEYIDEPKPGKYIHKKKERITEWPVAFLRRPRRTPRTVPDFLAPDAPANRLDILRVRPEAIIAAKRHSYACFEYRSHAR